MRKLDIVAIAGGGVIVAACAFVIWDFAGLPEQPGHPATARVVGIAAYEGKFHNDRETIVVRNAHGTGQFRMAVVDVHCNVGDQVPVQQRGVTLTRVAATCR